MKTKMTLSMIFALLCACPSQAEMSKQERKEAEKLVSGVFYTRIDAPCTYSAGVWGSGADKPIVEVSPTGYKIGATEDFKGGRLRSSGTSWGIPPNTRCGYAALIFARETVDVWFEAREDNNNDETIVRFVGIKTLKDFQDAFNVAFSRVPLQEAHDDWSSEIKKAVAEHRLMGGMTGEQAFCVVGTPVEKRSSTDGTKEVEIWITRQDKGVRPGRKQTSTATGFPPSLRFVDGVLTEIGAAETQPAR
ncbi:MAG: hypothetical protein AB1714_16165 [Acidobacteriota bacterium]